MTYKIEFRRADNSLVLENDETFAGIIHMETVAYDFSGTFSVPDFDDTKGMFYPQFEVVPRYQGIIDRPVGTPIEGRYGQPVYGTALLPSLNWDNSTKVMTVSPAFIPSGWSGFRGRPDYTVIFIHYR